MGVEAQLAQHPNLLVHRSSEHGDPRHALDRLQRGQGALEPADDEAEVPPDVVQRPLRCPIGTEHRVPPRRR